jgi:hypothetical protein
MKQQLNNYDFLKFLAIISMIIDHIGMFFLPEQQWLRGIGRLAFPIFLFLVGYSEKYKFSLELLILGILLTIFKQNLDFLSHEANIIFTIFLTRLLFKPLVKFKIFEKYQYEFITFNILIFIPSVLLFEYGSLAFLLAYLGHLSKNKININIYGKNLAFILLFNFLVQTSLFDNANIYFFSFFLLASIALAYLLYTFCLQKFSTKNTVFDKIVFIFSRNAILIYTFHFVLFAITSALLAIQ